MMEQQARRSSSAELPVPEQPSLECISEELEDSRSMGQMTLHEKIGMNQKHRQRLRDELDRIGLEKIYRDIDRAHHIKAKTKYGLLGRLQQPHSKLDGLSPAVKTHFIKTHILADCFPIEITKLAEEAELAYSKLLSLNNDIQMMDYGQAFYDDVPTLQRNKKRVLTKAEWDQEMIEDHEHIHRFVDEKARLDHEINIAGEKDPWKKIQRLREAMEEKHSEITTSLTSMKLKAVAADYMNFDHQINELQSEIRRIADSQYIKPTVGSLTSVKKKAKLLPTDIKKLVPKLGKKHIKTLSRSDHALMGVYFREKGKERQIVEK